MIGKLFLLFSVSAIVFACVISYKLYKHPCYDEVQNVIDQTQFHDFMFNCMAINADKAFAKAECQLSAEKLDLITLKTVCK